MNTQLKSLNCVTDACELGAGEFYYCSKCCEDGKTAYSFDIAMDTAFKCPKCGNGMKYIEPMAQSLLFSQKEPFLFTKERTIGKRESKRAPGRENV